MARPLTLGKRALFATKKRLCGSLRQKFYKITVFKFHVRQIVKLTNFPVYISYDIIKILDIRGLEI